jgi:hypothetical protein
VEVSIDGAMTEQRDLHVGNNVERSSTIGAMPKHRSVKSMDGLFEQMMASGEFTPN